MGLAQPASNASRRRRGAVTLPAVGSFRGPDSCLGRATEARPSAMSPRCRLTATRAVYFSFAPCPSRPLFVCALLLSVRGSFRQAPSFPAALVSRLICFRRGARDGSSNTSPWLPARSAAPRVAPRMPLPSHSGASEDVARSVRLIVATWTVCMNGAAAYFSQSRFRLHRRCGLCFVERTARPIGAV